MAFAVLLMVPSAALAQWMAEVEDDLFSEGKEARALGMATPEQGIHIECRSAGDLSFAFVEQGEFAEGMELVPVEMVVQIDGGRRHAFAGRLYQHNPRFLGIRAAAAADLVALLRDLRNARRTIAYGIHIPLIDERSSGKISAQGSTGAIDRLAEACGLELLD